jgi:hypothetical protein
MFGRKVNGKQQEYKDRKEYRVKKETLAG